MRLQFGKKKNKNSIRKYKLDDTKIIICLPFFNDVRELQLKYTVNERKSKTMFSAISNNFLSRTIFTFCFQFPFFFFLPFSKDFPRPFLMIDVS